MIEQSHILIVDDDPDIRKVLEILLKEKYFVSQAADGPSAIDYIRANPQTDLVVLDVMMPGMSGYDVCSELRKISNAPILFLTARTAEDDRITAYSSGGDDFLSKPFSPGELTAKVVSLLRRYREYRGKPDIGLSLGELEVDLASRSVKRIGVPVALTDTEYSILEYMLKNGAQTTDYYTAINCLSGLRTYLLRSDLPYSPENDIQWFHDTGPYPK